MSSESGERRPARARGMEAETETFPCPRCNSTNTKFCYYNNYNLCQPRYFCKSCRRYWTRGGALRNVPVGGGTRKRSRTSSAAALSPGNSRPVQSGPETMATGPGCEVNLNEAAPEPEPEPETETGSLGGGVEFAPLGEFGLGLEPSGLNDGFEIGLGLCDWPAESVGGEAGNINVGVSAATSWNDDGAWKIGERPLSDGGDCFGFPELAISAPGRKS